MKANTVEQFKILEYIDKNFNITEEIKINLIDRNTVKITDSTTSLIFTYKDGEIKYY